MSPLVNTSRFQRGASPDQSPEDQAEEALQLQGLEEEANAYVETCEWASLVREKVLAYGVGKILGLYLVQFAHPLSDGDWERWVVVGNLPSMNFETEDASTPALALHLYCAIGQDWADNVLAGRDLSDSYPIPVPPVKENAEQLLKIVSFIRRNLIPEAEECGAPAI